MVRIDKTAVDCNVNGYHWECCRVKNEIYINSEVSEFTGKKTSLLYRTESDSASVSASCTCFLESSYGAGRKLSLQQCGLQ